MPQIIVSPLSQIETVITQDAPSHLMSLLGPEYMIGTHQRFGAERHLRISTHDIAAPEAGRTHPQAEHVEDILSFSESWDRRQPILIHCFAGVSRSTAAAFMILCKLNPGLPEGSLLAAMRAAAPHIQPNHLLVAFADDALNRDGRMVDALDAVGPPAAYVTEGVIFSVPALLTAPKAR